MRFEIVFALKFRHGTPIAFWHLCHAAFGVAALFDGNGVIESLPQDAVVGLCLIRGRHLKILQGANSSLSGGIKQSLFIGAVIDKKPFVHIPRAEVAA